MYIFDNKITIENKAILEEYLELDQKLNFMFPPLTKTGSYDRNKLRETILEAKRIFESKGAVFNLRLVPEHMTQLICDAVPEIEFFEDRPNFDYIYRREDLVELRGKKYRTLQQQKGNPRTRNGASQK